jgi:hypothetical protein
MMSMQGPNKMRKARHRKSHDASHHSSPDQGEKQFHGGAIATILADRLALDFTRVGKWRRRSAFPPLE